MVDPAKSRSWRNALSVVAIFALGTVFGAALTIALGPGVRERPFGPRGGGPMRIERLSRELDLDAAQKERVRAIVERGHFSMRGLLDDTRAEIREVLRPDQRDRFDRMRPPGPPPPD